MQNGSYLIVGLGNPGPEYQKTRHNSGFRVVEAFAEKKGWKFRSSSKVKGRLAHGAIGGKTLFLLEPLTFMNESGLSVKACVDGLKIPLDHLIVVHDDIAFMCGELRMRGQGGAGGHNGLKSVAEHLNTEYYARLRVGIGAPKEEILADYVLEPFSLEEEELIKEATLRSVSILSVWIEEGKEAAMQIANAKKGENDG
ncbi:MAG: peptidyl-tRNA hydrolase [Chlamydiota bacterium]